MRRSLAMTLGCASALAACGGGDNSAVRAFHPTVRPGTLLADVIAAGEKAQAYDIRYSVRGRTCPEDEFYVERYSSRPLVRITHPAPDPGRSWERPYDETGYARREDFAKGLADTVPRFYPCKEFLFTFGRYQGWPRSDSFTVTVDEQGRLIAVSPLSEDRTD